MAFIDCPCREKPDVVKVLVEHKALKLNALNRHKRTALHLAVTTQQSDVIRVLLDRGADPNTQVMVDSELGRTST